MIQSSDRELAELRFGFGHGQKKTTKNNNKSRAEQEPRSAHGRAVNDKIIKSCFVVIYFLPWVVGLIIQYNCPVFNHKTVNTTWDPQCNCLSLRN